MSDKGPDPFFQQTEEETGNPAAVRGWLPTASKDSIENFLSQHFSTHLMHTSRRKSTKHWGV